MLRALFYLAIAWSFSSMVALAQAPMPAKKGDANGKDGDAGKAKLKEKEAPKQKITLDKLPTPTGVVILLVDQLREAPALFPDYVLLSPEAYLKLKALERQPANEKTLPSSCKLTGKLDGDFLLFSAEFGFATLTPKATVVLGLKGGFLTDAGSLDDDPPNLETSEEGFLVRVEKAGPHRLVLHFRVAAPIKKTAGNSLERAATLDMPGAAATTLRLELPRGVEDLTWNENIEKARPPGRWDLGLGTIKYLNLAWKEPIANTGNAPLARVDGQIVVRVEDSAVNLTAELFLEDLRPFSKEWLLQIPGQAKIIDVKGPNGATREWKVPGGGSPYYRIPDVSPGKWQVSISQRLPRPTSLGTRVPIGPFHVLGAFQHSGTITVQMPTEVQFGQRLLFTRFGKIEQIKNTETDTVFHYSMPTITDKMPKNANVSKAALELEWRNEKNQLETHVEHSLKLKATAKGWDVEETTRIKAMALFASFNSLDLKLPLPRPRGLTVIGAVVPGLAFPGAFSWGALWAALGNPGEGPATDDLLIIDEHGNPLKRMPQDAAGKVRVITERPPSKQMTVIIKNRFLIALPQQRLHLELPRPLNTIDRRAKLTIDTDERVELLHGPAGAEEPVPERHHFELGWEQSPAQVDLAWRPYHRQVLAQATIDITLFEHSALVKQMLQFPRESLIGGQDPKHQQVRLLIPRGVGEVRVLSGGEITSREPPNGKLSSGGVAWLHAAAEGPDLVKVVLQYDLAMSKPLVGAGADPARALRVTPIWPAHVSLKDVKIRIWATPASVPRLPKSELIGLWKERSIEMVAGKDQFPALVLQGYGAKLPLTLHIDEGAATPRAALIADRALLEIRTNEDGSQLYLARYWLRKIHGPQIEVELPMPLARFREAPTFVLGNKVLVAEKADALERTVLLRLHPDLMALPAVLEIVYTIPPDALERNTPWRTALLAPVFRSDVVIEQMRWRFDAPGQLMAFSLNGNARADCQWSLQSWLPTPESSMTAADLDAWFLGKESTRPPESVTYSFALLSMHPTTVYHVPRPWWLLGCSGVFLIVTLGGYFSPLSRLGYGLLLFALALASLVLGIVCPPLMPALAFGLQPGLLLLIVFVGLHWWLQERERRQSTFLPGFVRPTTGSTMVRSNVPKRPREASTIDAPTAAAEAKAEERPEVPPI